MINEHKIRSARDQIPHQIAWNRSQSEFNRSQNFGPSPSPNWTGSKILGPDSRTNYPVSFLGPFFNTPCKPCAIGDIIHLSYDGNCLMGAATQTPNVSSPRIVA